MKHGGILQLVMYKPEGPILKIRARDEGGERDPYREAHLKLEIQSSLLRLSELIHPLTVAERKRVEIRLTTNYMHFAQIVRVDNRMLVALYLSGKAGIPFPTFQLYGSEAIWFRTFLEQFSTTWSRADKFGDDELMALPKQVSEQL